LRIVEPLALLFLKKLFIFAISMIVALSEFRWLWYIEIGFSFVNWYAVTHAICARESHRKPGDNGK